MNKTLQENIKEITSLPGLAKVKEEIKLMVAYLENIKERKPSTTPKYKGFRE